MSILQNTIGLLKIYYQKLWVDLKKIFKFFYIKFLTLKFLNFEQDIKRIFLIFIILNISLIVLKICL